MTTKFRLKSKPSKPKRKSVEITYRIHFWGDYSQKLADVMAWCSENHLDPKEVIFRDDGCYDDSEMYAVGTRQETDEEYGVRMAEYKLKTKEYEKWTKANKAAIEKELANRAAQEKSKAEKQAEKVRKDLEVAEKKVAKLRNRLGLS